MIAQNKQLEEPLRQFNNNYKVERESINAQIKKFEYNRDCLLKSLQTSLESAFAIKPETKVVVIYKKKSSWDYFEEAEMEAYYMGVNMDMTSPSLRFNKIKANGDMSIQPDARRIPINCVVSMVKA